MVRKISLVVVMLISAGLGALVLMMVLTRVDATLYAPGFSESKFRSIRQGMSRADVERILGKPLTHRERITDDKNRWIYASLDYDKIPEDADDDRVCNTWFELREVDFDKQGRVTKTVAAREQFE